MGKPRQAPPLIGLRGPVLLLVLAATAVPLGLRNPQSIDLSIARHDPIDLVLNILGFMPVGIVLARLGSIKAVAAAALLSLAVEAGQIVMLFRFPALADVLTNTLGAGIGVVIARRYAIAPVLKATTRAAIASMLLATALAASIWFLRLSSGTFDATEAGTPGSGGVEAHWIFGEAEGTVAHDSSGHGRDGTYLGNSQRLAGPPASAVKLNGDSDFVDFGHPAGLMLTGSLTVSAWIKSNAFPRDDAAIVSSHNGLGFQLDTTIDTGLRTVGFKLGSACGTLMARYGATPLQLDTWYYVTGVYDSNAETIDVYLNGDLDNGRLLGPVTNAQRASRVNVLVGRRNDLGYGFGGAIGNVRIYSRPLTKNEIATDMWSTFGAAPPQPTETIGLGRMGRDQHPLCWGSSDPEDAHLPAVAALLGTLVSFACIGLLPRIGLLPLLLSGAAAGLLLTPVALSNLAGLIATMLGLAGGVAVAAGTKRPSPATRDAFE